MKETIALKRIFRGGLVGGKDGDTPLLYTDNADSLIDYSNMLGMLLGKAVNYASFFAMPSPECSGNYRFVHIQPNHIRTDIRTYNTRYVYEIGPSDLRKVNYSFYSILLNLPRMRKFNNDRELEYDIDSKYVIQLQGNSSFPDISSDDIYKYLCYCIWNNKKIFLKLSNNNEKYYENGVIESGKLKNLLLRIEYLPECVRKFISIGFSVDHSITKLVCNDAVPFIVAHQDELSVWGVEKSEICEFNWEGDSLVIKGINKPSDAELSDCIKLVGLTPLSQLDGQVLLSLDDVVDATKRVRKRIDSLIKNFDIRNGLSKEDESLLNEVKDYGIDYCTDEIEEVLDKVANGPIKDRETLFSALKSKNEARLAWFESMDEINSCFNASEETWVKDFVDLCDGVGANIKLLDKIEKLQLFEQSEKYFAGKIIESWGDKQKLQDFLDAISGKNNIIEIIKQCIENKPLADDIENNLKKLSTKNSLAKDIYSIIHREEDSLWKRWLGSKSNDSSKQDTHSDSKVQESPKLEVAPSTYDKKEIDIVGENKQLKRKLKIHRAVNGVLAALVIGLFVAFMYKDNAGGSTTPVNLVCEDSSTIKKSDTVDPKPPVEPAVVGPAPTENGKDEFVFPENRDSFTYESLLELSKEACENPRLTIKIGDKRLKLDSVYVSDDLAFVKDWLKCNGTSSVGSCNVRLFYKEVTDTSEMIKDFLISMLGNGRTYSKINTSVSINTQQTRIIEMKGIDNDRFRDTYQLEPKLNNLLYYFYLIQEIERIKQNESSYLDPSYFKYKDYKIKY